ncbi:hypothetical protein [Streptomyces parvus]|uniref:hypothetical protein n=1 Tax=Streptomyces parvus TaxID=66428 RepID=UPI002100DB16|nr:hypothetical protein [Streptomyces parvus]MCQ1580396.1 hypothetical protein [Streptomyces parvus]
MPEHLTGAAVFPTQVTTVRHDLWEATGQDAYVERTSPLHYLLILTSERVELTITWRRNYRGDWKWNNSTLTVDGMPRELARDLDDFVHIWKDPDVLSRPGGRSEIPALAPVDDETQLPSIVRQTLDRMRKNAERKASDGSVRAIAAATGTGYTIEVAGPKGTLHLHYRPSQRFAGVWALAERDGFRMFDANGMDRTKKFAGNLMAALADVFGLGTAPAVPGQTGHARQTAVNNSVRVRRHSVIRV